MPAADKVLQPVLAKAGPCVLCKHCFYGVVPNVYAADLHKSITACPSVARIICCFCCCEQLQACMQSVTMQHGAASAAVLKMFKSVCMVTVVSCRAALSVGS
jgi:hypothetical protein